MKYALSYLKLSLPLMESIEEVKMGNKGKTIYREFGQSDESALERGVPDRPPQDQNLRLQTSRKGRGGKTVTVISGFEAKPETLNVLLKQLKAHCGTGGTVKDNTLEIQGDHREKLLPFLLKAGYKAKISGG